MTRIKALFTLVTLPLYLPVAIVKTIIAEQKRAAAVEAGLYAKLEAANDAYDAYDAAYAAWDAKLKKTQEENADD